MSDFGPDTLPLLLPDLIPYRFFGGAAAMCLTRHDPNQHLQRAIPARDVAPAQR